MNVNKISLVIASKNPNIEHLKQALECYDLFDEVVVHSNLQIDDSIIPSKCIKIIDCNPIPAYQAYNDAIKIASSEWILPLADDDYLDRENLEVLITHIQKNLCSADIIYSKCYINKKDLWGKEFFCYEDLKRQNCVPFTSFYKKETWEKIGGYPPLKFNDWAYWMIAYKIGMVFQYIPYPFFHFRQGHKQTLSDKERNEQDFKKTRQEILNYVDNLK